ncbi:hypothetical protein [Erythrobacter sp. YJ-T3-07]|uniref:hypothetical protein n=1 Tax=Erythrobacter sp. YJ-T3-07 TaxID=2793063 RepID=UPI001F4024C8|nr:hypothetical protein [Erythrobacter sp. YJ-T3-07]
MTNRFRFAIPMLAAFAVASTPALAERQTGQERLDKLLEGRVAGEPSNCVPHRPSARLYIIDKTAVVYDTGSTIYVNYTQDPEALDDDDYLVVRDPSPSLCRTTQITTRDRTGNFFSGAVFLTDFIPYKRVKDEG